MSNELPKISTDRPYMLHNIHHWSLIWGQMWAIDSTHHSRLWYMVWAGNEL